MGLDVNYEMGSGACIAHLVGDMDMAVVPGLQSDFDNALGAGCTSVVLDLSEVDYADSSALGLIVWLDRRLGPGGGRLVLAGASRDVARILELSGLVEVAETVVMSPTVDAALEGLSLPPQPTTPCWSQRLEFPPQLESLSVARQQVIDAIEPLGFGSSALYDIKVAVGEAVANAVRHGAPSNGDGEVRVDIFAYDDRVVIEVADNGPGFDGRPEESDDVYRPHGRGVMFMRALMDGVEFRRSDAGGTVVELVKHRPVRIDC